MIRVVMRLICQGLTGMTINPWAQLLTMTAVLLVSFLVGLFLMSVTTLDQALSTVRGETSYQIYWRPGQEQTEIDMQWRQLQELPGLIQMNAFTPAQALKELENRLGRSASGRNFPFLAENNPLPATALLSVKPGDADQATPAAFDRWLKETTQYFWSLPGVERVAATPLRDELGATWRKVNLYVLRPAILFLTLLQGLIVGNTVRLAMLARSQEVEILQLVGAFSWYIRLPLLVCGAAQGFLGSGLALVILRFIHLQIRDLLNFPPLMLEIRFLTPESIILMLLAPTLTGILGGWVGMKKYN